MKAAAKPILNDTQTIHMLPLWVTSASAQDTDSVAFTSGAALVMLDVVLRDPGGTLPSALLRDRAALEAAIACLKLENRHEKPSDIRDAVCWRGQCDWGGQGTLWAPLAICLWRGASWQGLI